MSGTDVYVAGYENVTTEVGPGQFVVAGVAKYWRNGVATALTDGTNDAAATSIAIFGSDIYIGGWETSGGVSVAKVWKNGTAQAVTDAHVRAKATGVLVSG